MLIAFFADPRIRARDILAGQYLGIAALVAASLVVSLISLVLSPHYVGLLGLVPIALGVKELIDRRRGADDDDDVAPRAGWGNVLTVAAVTVANGGDNIGVYTPVFATSAAPAIATTCAVFAVLVAAWVAFARWLVNHPAIGAPIRRVAHAALPFVLIAIGVLVLFEAGSLSLLSRAPLDIAP